MSTINKSSLAIQTTTDGFYSPLLGQRDIRLLEVLPGDDSDIIVTSLVTVSLDSKPTYAALSYAWGDATQMSIIQCNGKSISITTSLAEALKAFRSFSAGPDAPLKKFQRIWADQLCINQHDVLERNHQVGIMGLVYRNSACAFIWLGPGDEDSDRGMSLTDSVNQKLGEWIRRRNDSDWSIDVSYVIADVVGPLDDQAWASLEAFFLRPWFHRSWTFQEPIRAPDRMIACGSQIRKWTTFGYAASLIVCSEYTRRITDGLLAFLVMFGAITQKSEDLRLSRLIITTWKREASDPRDKVYALYGLVQDYQKVPLEISYAMSVEDVYRSTVRFCIENEGSLSVLSQSTLFRNQSDLPSWVPDWRDCFRSGCSPVNEIVSTQFNASSMSRPLLVPSSSNDKLILKGFILAIVERTIDIAALKVNAADSFPESWITNAAAAGVPMRFLQGKTFHTSYDLTMSMEASPFHRQYEKGITRQFWPHIIEWVVAGSQIPIPQAVWREYTDRIGVNTFRRLLFLTKDSLGLAPEPTQVGDRVCILLGGNAPFILRPRQNTARSTPSKEVKPERLSTAKTTPQHIKESRHEGSRNGAHMAKQALEATEWTLIGDCYLHGYMHGEAMETVTEADYVNFTLV